MDHVSTVLEIQDLHTSFFTAQGEIKAVDGISLTVHKGRTLGIVGESGSGKSILSLSILRLIQKPGRIKRGKILYNGENLLDKSDGQMRKLRGNHISMIFQEPMTSLNPVFTVGDQIAEAYQIHEQVGRKEALNKAVQMLKLVGIPSPEKRIRQYPFQLSGGMRQRVMIAMALACNPDLLIADEPTTALDVTIQAQILELMKELQQKLQMSIIFITHDLGIVAETCDDVAVMYYGKLVEYTDVRTLFKHPKHPYTIGLLNSLPRHDLDKEVLEPIQGSVPSPFDTLMGCSFAPRCPHARQLCHDHEPELQQLDEQQQVRCWQYADQWENEAEVNSRS
ncbi:ABC transporter ATP-binding protein [Paenibacillus sp. JCM 10914]|uniref:ABC transporter ATP-binding protein n=1 Tax=Paenibacillus sp. JCM 10914 TaxID=1236974 RepID=UPI0003CC79DE|nr:ABC transporter ATP-binding protein [Paenibacillus sp. JCM 10914]GAE05992.1 oligopeptide transport ATP-binding protein OppD [Paenibacillus sp. JCM 10914]